MEEKVSILKKEKVDMQKKMNYKQLSDLQKEIIVNLAT